MDDIFVSFDDIGINTNVNGNHVQNSISHWRSINICVYMDNRNWVKIEVFESFGSKTIAIK